MATAAGELREALSSFGSDAVRGWAAGLGIETFVGTSGRVFPTDLKAAPLLRAWLHRLRAAGVRLHTRHRWTGWDGDHGRAGLRYAGRTESRHAADATVLALGGASWPRLGSDGAWVPLLAARGVDIAPLQPANCGFDVSPTRPGAAGWSDFLRQRFAGQPVKPVAARLATQAPQDSVARRVRADRHRHRRQPGVRLLRARCATRSPPTGRPPG